MEHYVCKLADRQELCRRWEQLVAMHPGNQAWEFFRENTLKHFDAGCILPYIGVLEGKIICEMTAYIRQDAFEGDLSQPDGLLTGEMAYLAAFRTDPPYENRGYFGKLYRFAEGDLLARGYRALSLGVGPEAVRNLQIYFHLGFTEYLKTTVEHDPPRFPGDVPPEEYVNFYKKILLP